MGDGEHLAQKRRREWNHMRQTLAGITDPKKIAYRILISYADPICSHVRKPVRDDIIQILITKLKGNYTHSMRRGVATDGFGSAHQNFLVFVCNCPPHHHESISLSTLFSNCSVNALRMLFDVYDTNVGLMTPVEEAGRIINDMWSSYLGTMPRRYSWGSLRRQGAQKELLGASSIAELRSNENLANLCSLWEKTELLAKISMPLDSWKKSPEQLPLVHQLIRTSRQKIVVWFALQMYPNQAKFKDDCGRLPLHWAALLYDVRDCVPSILNSADFEKMRVHLEKSMVELTLDVFPGGAECRDKKGLLPLDLLLDVECRSWDIDHEEMHRSALSLVGANIDALSQINPLTKMLPFMTAACVYDETTHKTKTNFENESRKMLQRKLELTYAILLKNPAVILRVIQDSPAQDSPLPEIGNIPKSR